MMVSVKDECLDEVEDNSLQFEADEDDMKQRRSSVTVKIGALLATQETEGAVLHASKYKTGELGRKRQKYKLSQQLEHSDVFTGKIQEKVFMNVKIMARRPTRRKVIAMPIAWEKGEHFPAKMVKVEHNRW